MSKLRFALTLALACVVVFGSLSVRSVEAAQSAQSSASAVHTPDQLTYRMEFSGPQLERVRMYGETFTKFYLKGATSIGDSYGAPEVQVAPLQLLIPQGSEVSSVEIVTGDRVVIDAAALGFDLVSAEPIVPAQPSVPFGYPAPEKISFDQAAYGSAEVFPGTLYKSHGVDYCRGYGILTLNIFPAEYIPAEGELSYYSDMTVVVNLENTGNIHRFYRHGNQDDRQWVGSLVANPEVVDTYDTPLRTEYPGGLCDPDDNGGRGYDYVIICRESLLNFDDTYDWDDLMARKESQGIEPTKISVEAILACGDYENPDPLFNDTAARIREFLRDAYADWGLEYVLVAGDQDGSAQVVRRLLDYYYESNCESDLYWSNLDETFNDDGDNDWGEEGDTGFDLYSELWIGSISCDTGGDISNWLTKSFYYADNYEPDYLENAGFYGGDTGWNCQGDDFIDYSAIYGYDYWPGPVPEDYPDWLWFQYGFDSWNQEKPGLEYDISVQWTAEPPNPGWQGGSTGAAIAGLCDAISNDQCTLISGVAHAYSGMSLDVYDYEWESNYHNTMPFFLTDYGCHCGDMNAEDDGVLHSMLFHSDTELAFAVVYHTGYGWGNFDSAKSSSALQQKSFWDYHFNPDLSGGNPNHWQMGRAHAWSKDLMAPTIDWDEYGSYRGTIESCLLFGDPAQVLKPPASEKVVGYIQNSSDLNPISGAMIEITETNSYGLSDSTGHYQIWGGFPDSVTVIVSKFGFFSDTSRVEIVSEGTTHHSVLLDPIAPGTLNGSVTDYETGDPCPATITLLWYGTPVVQTQTDPFTGSFEFIIAEGTYDVRVVPDLPYLPTSELDVAVVEGEVTTVDFVILPVSTFTEISETAGVDDNGFGEGVAWGDYDGDGLADLYVCNLSGSNVLYHNLGGGMFEDVTSASGTGDVSSSFACVWADYDKDNDLDLYVTNRNADNRLYQNNGGVFTDVAGSAGVGGSGSYSQGAAWADYDRDGKIDLFVANRYSYDFLFRNLGNGTFARADSAAGIRVMEPSKAVAWADYDDDGDPDLFVACSYGPNMLYRNQGNGTFVDVAPALGIDDDGAANGAAWGDFDLDQDLDLFVANDAASDQLFVNEGGTFMEAASSAGLAYAGASRSPTWVDLDKDNDLDLLLTTGTRIRYYVNDGTGVFAEIPNAAGLDGSSLGEGGAVADIDGDGNVDYGISRSQFAANRLYLNNGNLYHYFGVKLNGRLSNRDGIGARITVTVDGLSMMREVTAGSGLFSMNEMTQYFGLAEDTVVDEVLIEWPSGRTQTFHDLAADQVIEVTEQGHVVHKVAFPL